MSLMKDKSGTAGYIAPEILKSDFNRNLYGK